MREGLVVLRTQAEERSCEWLQLGLAKKLNSNSLASWSKDEIEKGFNQLHHIHAGPRRVLREARHIRVLDMLYRAILARKELVGPPKSRARAKVALLQMALCLTSNYLELAYRAQRDLKVLKKELVRMLEAPGRDLVGALVTTPTIVQFA
ncbi:hypothetical protein GW17_00018298 [Ensete ventricosum]|nr:hypothetical protein GW17_00018298 [Ensete ventricosum]